MLPKSLKFLASVRLIVAAGFSFMRLFVSDLVVDMETVFSWIGKYEIQFRLLQQQLAKSQQATLDALNEANKLRQRVAQLESEGNSPKAE